MSDSASLLPLVSVIVPVRDGERFLADALRSVLAQDYRPFEIIVMDGHSKDRTEQIARSFAKVRFLTQPGKGLPNAYNSAIAAARGEWVAFLECDDLWTPEKLTVQIHYMRLSSRVVS
jgi:glycosyltransferase involved in cell wall biosynthesis